jgi:hypothetical protein
VAAIDERDDLHGPGPPEVHQRVHGCPNRSSGTGDVVHQDHHPVIHRRGHLRAAKGRPGATAGQIVAIKGRVEDPHHGVQVGDLAEIRRQLPGQGNAPVGHTHQVEIAEILAALDDLVGDPHQGAADGKVVQNDSAGRITTLGLSRLLRVGAGGVVGHLRTFFRLAGRT